MNKKDASKRWTTRATSVSEAINTHLWDAGVGAYLDSTNFTTSFNQSRHAQDGNGIAVLTGVAPPSRAKSALDYLSTHTRQRYGNAFYDGELPDVDNATQRVYAFISFFELQGRFLTEGFAESAIEEINRLYGWMASHDPTVTDWEGIGPGGSLYEQGYTSMAHGWSTGIVSLMSNYVLGVMPTTPGFATWNLKPVPAGLEWASGRVSTPHGDIDVSWSVKANTFTMSFNVPKGTTAKVCVPAADGQKVTLDGKAMRMGSRNGYMVLNTVVAGKHEIHVT
jgi:hypothetical protein